MLAVLLVEVATLGNYHESSTVTFRNLRKILQYKCSYNTIYSVNVSLYEGENWLGISLRGSR